MTLTARDLSAIANRSPHAPTRRKLRSAGALAPKLPIGGDEPVTVTLSIRTTTESNTGGHFAAKARRAKQQRNGLYLPFYQTGKPLPALPVVVTFTRLAPGTLDAHDNYPSALKHVADSVADLYGVRDDDERIAWRYAPQVKQKGYAVRIEIAPNRGFRGIPAKWAQPEKGRQS